MQKSIANDDEEYSNAATRCNGAARAEPGRGRRERSEARPGIPVSAGGDARSKAKAGTPRANGVAHQP
jgi:hypothetical protein